MIGRLVAVLLRKTAGRFGVFALVAAAVALALGGCGADGDVATLGAGAPATGSTDQAGAAEAFHSCLRAAGLPASLEQVDGGVSVGWDQDGHDILSSSPVLGVAFVRGLSRDLGEESADAAFGAFTSSHRVEEGYSWGLEVDGVDYSDTYEECWESSGYTDPVAAADPAVEMLGKRLVADSTNAWLACARENGYPDWADVDPGVPDDWWTSPTAYIPLSMAPEELRALLAACPNFDADLAERIEDPGTDWSGGYEFQPSILVEELDPGADGVPTDDMERRREELGLILQEAEQGFYEQRAATQEAG
jgi:hypothetical protein